MWIKPRVESLPWSIFGRFTCTESYMRKLFLCFRSDLQWYKRTRVSYDITWVSFYCTIGSKSQRHIASNSLSKIQGSYLHIICQMFWFEMQLQCFDAKSKLDNTLNDVVSILYWRYRKENFIQHIGQSVKAWFHQVVGRRIFRSMSLDTELRWIIKRRQQRSSTNRK